MNQSPHTTPEENREEYSDDEKLDHALTQMEALYRSRCVTPPTGSNVIVREIDDSERE